MNCHLTSVQNNINLCNSIGWRQELCVQLKGAFTSSLNMSVVISLSNIIFAASGKDILQGAFFVPVQGKEVKKSEREGALFSRNLKCLGLMADFFICDGIWCEWLSVRCLTLAKTILILCEISVRDMSPQLAGAYNHSFIGLWKNHHCDFSSNKEIVCIYKKNSPKMKAIGIDTCYQWCWELYKVSMSSVENSKQKQMWSRRGIIADCSWCCPWSAAALKA